MALLISASSKTQEVITEAIRLAEKARLVIVAHAITRPTCTRPPDLSMVTLEVISSSITDRSSNMEAIVTTTTTRMAQEDQPMTRMAIPMDTRTVLMVTLSSERRTSTVATTVTTDSVLASIKVVKVMVDIVTKPIAVATVVADTKSLTWMTITEVYVGDISSSNSTRAMAAIISTTTQMVLVDPNTTRMAILTDMRMALMTTQSSVRRTSTEVMMKTMVSVLASIKVVKVMVDMVTKPIAVATVVADTKSLTWMTITEVYVKDTRSSNSTRAMAAIISTMTQMVLADPSMIRMATPMDTRTVLMTILNLVRRTSTEVTTVTTDSVLVSITHTKVEVDTVTEVVVDTVTVVASEVVDTKSLIWMTIKEVFMDVLNSLAAATETIITIPMAQGDQLTTRMAIPMGTRTVLMATLSSERRTDTVATTVITVSASEPTTATVVATVEDIKSLILMIRASVTTEAMAHQQIALTFINRHIVLKVMVIRDKFTISNNHKVMVIKDKIIVSKVTVSNRIKTALEVMDSVHLSVVGTKEVEAMKEDIKNASKVTSNSLKAMASRAIISSKVATTHRASTECLVRTTIMATAKPNTVKATIALVKITSVKTNTAKPITAITSMAKPKMMDMAKSTTLVISLKISTRTKPSTKIIPAESMTGYRTTVTAQLTSTRTDAMTMTRPLKAVTLAILTRILPMMMTKHLTSALSRAMSTINSLITTVDMMAMTTLTMTTMMAVEAALLAATKAAMESSRFSTRRKSAVSMRTTTRSSSVARLNISESSSKSTRLSTMVTLRSGTRPKSAKRQSSITRSRSTTTSNINTTASISILMVITILILGAKNGEQREWVRKHTLCFQTISYLMLLSCFVH